MAENRLVDARSILGRYRSSRRTALRDLGRCGAAAAFSAFGTLPRSAGAATTRNTMDGLDPDTEDSIARALWLPEPRAGHVPPEVLTRLADPKNANRAFGERMAFRLRALLAQPDSFLPDYEQRYTTLLDYCDTLSPHQAYAMSSSLLGGDKTRDYAQLAAPADLRFPQANGMALETETGWYFLVGSCRDRDGAEYGVEFMLFRYALLPLPTARHFGLSAVENQVLELHLGLSTMGGRHYQAKPIIVAGTTGLLEFATDAIGASLGKNTFHQVHPDRT